MFTRLWLGCVLGMTLVTFSPGANAASSGQGPLFTGADSSLFKGPTAAGGVPTNAKVRGFGGDSGGGGRKTGDPRFSQILDGFEGRGDGHGHDGHGDGHGCGHHGHGHGHVSCH